MRNFFKGKRTAIIALLILGMLGSVTMGLKWFRGKVIFYEQVRFKADVIMDGKDVSIENLRSTDNIVYLSGITVFSTWGDATTGSSYYQMRDGITYVVDPIALVNSRPDVPLNAGGGVTLHLPRSDKDSHESISRVIWAQGDSGTSGTPVAFTIQVWPAPETGTTSFRAGAYGSQNMTQMATSGTSVITTGVNGSYNINSVGETGTWILFEKSATSAVMLRSGVMTP